MITTHNLEISPRIHLYKLCTSQVVNFRTSILINIALNIIQRLVLEGYISMGRLSELRGLRLFMDSLHITYIFHVYSEEKVKLHSESIKYA